MPVWTQIGRRKGVCGKLLETPLLHLLVHGQRRWSQKSRSPKTRFQALTSSAGRRFPALSRQLHGGLSELSLPVKFQRLQTFERRAAEGAKIDFRGLHILAHEKRPPGSRAGLRELRSRKPRKPPETVCRPPKRLRSSFRTFLGRSGKRARDPRSDPLWDLASTRRKRALRLVVWKARFEPAS